MFPDQTILFECTGHCLDHAAHRNRIKINLRLAAYLLSECIQDFLNHDRWRTSVVSMVRSASSRELQPLRICICYSLVKFSRSRAALWLATVECSFYKRRSSWCGRGNGKSQLAECATEIAGECVDEKHFTPWKPISHVAAVLFGPRSLQRKQLQRPGLSQAESSGILQEPGRLQLYDGYRDGGRGNLGTRNRLLAVVAARDLRANCASRASRASRENPRPGDPQSATGKISR